MTTLHELDYTILQFIQNNFHSPILDKMMIFATYLGNSSGVWIVLALFLMISKKYRPIGLTITGALFLCLFIGNLTLKPYFARIRPFEVYKNVLLLIKMPSGFSFPSGHTMTSFAAATVLFLNHKRWGLWAFGLASAISFSRIYLFVHYPSDIVGGMLIGILIGLLSVKVFLLLNKFSNNSK